MNKLEFAAGDINSNERGTGARANEGKVSLSLVPFHLLAGVARVFMGGKLKYKEWNWSKGMKFSICADCLLRHFIKWWFCGEDTDPESGENHLDYMICNLLMLKHYSLTYTEGDDRPPAFTNFSAALDDINTPFNMEDFLNRNPAIRTKLEKEENNVE